MFVKTSNSNPSYTRMGLCQGYGFRALLGFSLYKVWTISARCSFLAMHSLLSFTFHLYILAFATFAKHLDWANEFCHHVLSMWPTINLECGDGSSEEDQMCISIQKQFRKQVSLVSCLFVYVLHLKLCILHFRVLCHSSNIHSQVLCIPCLCVYAHCWSAKRIRDV